VFRNLLIADSGKGHVEEMVRMLRDIPTVRQARINLLHVVPEQAGDNYTEHSQKAAGIVAEAVQRLALNPSEVNTIIRQGDTKQTVLKVADELDADLIVMGSRGLGRLQSILSNSASQYVFQLSTRPMLLVRDDLYVRHVNRVMVAVDGTGVGDDAITLACELVRDIPGGSLTGIHISRQDITPSRGGKSPADEVLEKAVQRARSFGVEMKAIHSTGDIGRGVCAAAADQKADLLVIVSGPSALGGPGSGGHRQAAGFIGERLHPCPCTRSGAAGARTRSQALSPSSVPDGRKKPGSPEGGRDYPLMPSELFNGWPLRMGGRGCSALTAAGLDVEHQQEHRRNQHEHQAGDEAEIVGFHRKSLQPADRITAGWPFR